MTFLDILLLIPICWFGFLGFKNGLIYEVSTIIALVLGCWVAYRFSDWFALVIVGSDIARPLAMILTFAVVVVLVRLVGKAVQKIVKLTIPGAVDHIFGMLFGVGKVLVVASVILYLVQSLDRMEIIIKKETKEQSFTYKYVEPIVPHAMHWNDKIEWNIIKKNKDKNED